MGMGDPDEEILTVDELTDILTEATGSTPGEIEQEADALEVGHPSEAQVVGPTALPPTIENRDADYGIIVFECESYMPDEVGYFHEFNSERLSIALSEDEDDDIEPGFLRTSTCIPMGKGGSTGVDLRN